MSKVTPTSSRKTDHIRINLVEDVRSGLTNGLENYHFMHEALPEISLSEVDLSLNFLGKHLQAPLLISSMTGGTPQAEQINKVLAIKVIPFRLIIPTFHMQIGLIGRTVRIGFSSAACNQMASEIIQKDPLILIWKPDPGKSIFFRSEYAKSRFTQ